MSTRPQEWRVRLVAQRLKEGAVIAYPTEGVWGLGCLPESSEAVARILNMKSRSWKKGLILLAGSIQEIEPYISHLSEKAREILEKAWPAPITFLIEDNGLAPEWIRGEHSTVAIRVSDHPVVTAICKRVDGPIVSTSANPAGKDPAVSKLRLHKYFPHGIDYVFPGELGQSRGASEIRELSTGVVRRASQNR